MMNDGHYSNNLAAFINRIEEEKIYIVIHSADGGYIDVESSTAHADNYLIHKLRPSIWRLYTVDSFFFTM